LLGLRRGILLGSVGVSNPNSRREVSTSQKTPVWKIFLGGSSRERVFFERRGGGKGDGRCVLEEGELWWPSSKIVRASFSSPQRGESSFLPSEKGTQGARGTVVTSIPYKRKPVHEKAILYH